MVEIKNAILGTLYYNFPHGAYAFNSPSVDCSTSEIGANRISFGYCFYSHGGKYSYGTEVNLDFMFHKKSDKKD